jgi:hypothetical protein
MPVAPCGELRAQRCTDSDQIQTITCAGEADILSGHTENRIPERDFACLDRFPTFLERTQIPAVAADTNDPQATAR